MWEQYDPQTTTLECAFERLWRAAGQFDEPWSIAELKLTDSDVCWLQTWFSHLPPDTADIWAVNCAIDIGGLNGVLLGNAPPGPANHRQRAGRAGRRADGSAVVVTFARSSEYDRDVFQRFGDFLKRPLRRPTVYLDRDRIIRRHLHAVLFSAFLCPRQADRTGAMQAFGHMARFSGLTIPPRWTEKSAPKPLWPPKDEGLADQFMKFLELLRIEDAGLKQRLADLVRGTSLTVEIDSWTEFIDHAATCYRHAMQEWSDDLDSLREAWNQVPSQPATGLAQERAKANSIRYQIKELCDITVIEWLADHRFLPRYGFPINLQCLTVRRPTNGDRVDRSAPDERYRLERSSLLALAEYVPESQILVGGYAAVSRGLRKHWTDSNLDKALGLQYMALECQEEHVYLSLRPDDPCPTCNGKPRKLQQLIFPRFGYTTAGWEPCRRETNLERVGEQTVRPPAEVFTESDRGDVIENAGGLSGVKMTYREEAPLLVRNSGSNALGFAICTRCGFSMSESGTGQGRMDLPDKFESHASIYSADPLNLCWRKSEQSVPVLRNRVLAAREFTDMLLVEWPAATSNNYRAVYTLGRAMLLAGSRMLELDHRELGIEIVPLRAPSLGIVVYDTSPGGAGHCLELCNAGRRWIEQTRAVLYVDAAHHARCPRACLECILDFSGQHRAHDLDRWAALELLDQVMH